MLLASSALALSSCGGMHHPNSLSAPSGHSSERRLSGATTTASPAANETLVCRVEEHGIPATRLDDEQLLDHVERQTFRYFWDYAEPRSGMARERYLPSDPDFDAHIVTTGGSGFGLMALVTGIERGWVTREVGVGRLARIADFLEEADRFHGAWSHWIDGRDGHVIPFGPSDDGGDLVETAFLAAGLVTVREYLSRSGDIGEARIAERFDALWREIDWDWYRNDQKVLYWHWSPRHQWEMNFPLRGYNETLITYVMAIASPTHRVDAKLYHEGWADAGALQILEPNGMRQSPEVVRRWPLFWAHYSYLGLDPRGLSDRYANYWSINVEHTRSNYQHCVSNPNHYANYGPNFWGLTASYTHRDDGSTGYRAHCPEEDSGVVAPTAAISSIPYLPRESIAAARNFYENHHENLWGPAGFYDAASPHHHWTTQSYLAIDQGPQVVMIENYRSGLIWSLFMRAPEVREGLARMGFHSTVHGI